MTISLSTCRKGDPLKLRCGHVAEYDTRLPFTSTYRHIVKLGDCCHTYMDNGRYLGLSETQHDVVEILLRKPAPIVTAAQLASAERHLGATVRVARASRVPARTRDAQRVLRAAVAYCGDRSGIMPNYIRLCDAVTDYKKYAEKRRKAKK